MANNDQFHKASHHSMAFPEVEEVLKKTKQVNEILWEIPQTYKQGMLVPARIYATEHLLKEFDRAVFDQLTNVATLPGIVKHALCMPDGHSGYGFPIGGVAAMDPETGVISPGGLGFDLNCGMRLVRTNLSWKDVEPKLRSLVDELFRAVPSGVGMGGFVKLNKGQLDDISVAGAKWCIENGYGWEEDLENIEDNGTIPNADPAKVSDRAKSRGIGQLGTLGSGNHYLEVQVIDEKNIFDAKLAKKFGLFAGQVCVMVHCGSRGFGHQIATDYLEIFLKKAKDYGINLIDKELACAPFQSKQGQDYFKAMPCAANLAFANRQVILHRIRESFSKIFGQDAESLGMGMIYDVAHNIGKLEDHIVDGEKKELLVHRKGATRCFGPGRKELAAKFQETGQPVIIGGSMETGSHLLVGTKKAELETWGSTMHGSGRTMSRTQAKRQVRGDELQKSMEKRGIYVRTASFSGLAEEAGFAYKNISEVVETMEKAGISHKVVAFTPKGNVKG